MRFVLTCLFTVVLTLSVSAAQMRDTVAVPIHTPTQPRVWLTVEVLEKKPSLGNKSSAFNEFIPVVIVDSATNAYLYALSGEMVEIGKQRTYFVSVVSGEDILHHLRDGDDRLGAADPHGDLVESDLLGFVGSAPAAGKDLAEPASCGLQGNEDTSQGGIG